MPSRVLAAPRNRMQPAPTVARFEAAAASAAPVALASPGCRVACCHHESQPACCRKGFPGVDCACRVGCKPFQWACIAALCLGGGRDLHVLDDCVQ